jgi:carbonic anhydrase/acetyltransferase-like protein (isoleucine patch superfamily)
MTFTELCNRIGEQQELDWRQHENGGGWLHRSAIVDASAFIGENAIIWGKVSGDAWVYGNAQVSGNARVYGDAQVYGNAQVYGDAQVSGNAQVYGDAQVSGIAWVSGNARVYGDAQVSGNAWVSGNARVSGDAQVSGNARVSSNARVSGDAQVSGNAWVSGDAWVSGNAWEKSPLFIIGSRHALTNAKHGHVQVGCKCETFEWWLSKEGESFARENNYADEEISEYRAYIELFKRVGK